MGMSGGRDRRAVEMKEALDMSYSTALRFVRGEYGVTPQSAECLIAMAARARGWELKPGKPCRCAECAMVEL